MNNATFSTPARPLPTSKSEPVDFLKLLPFIRSRAQKSFSRLNPDAREEAVQEVVANSFAAYRRLIERGKTAVIAAKPLARFAIAQTRVGRQVGGHLNSLDLSSRYCQHRRGISLQSLERFDEATQSWKELLVEDRTSTTADIVAIKLDFERWLELLPERQRQIAQALSTGESVQAVARLYRVTSARVSQLRRHFQAAWEAFQGEGSAAALALA